MESDLGKLFVGGISWDTNEDRLREYFQNYGEVVEAVIMRDRITGRARGFGFVVFSDPSVTERVVSEKHSIDGRLVEAKKAVPRDDQHATNRSNGSTAHGSPGPVHTKKIFVGGLASSVTEGDFKKYFDQFGAITDVVVMYDHNTQRPRGFGFITYDSEEAVDRVLVKSFHELNGKMVEVKKAVPKELSPVPVTRSPSLNRINNFLNGHNLGSLSPRMDGRFGSVGNIRNGYPHFGPVGYGMGSNFEPRLSPSYGGNGAYNNGIGYNRTLSPFYNGSPTRYSIPIGFGSANGGLGPMATSNSRNIWGSGSLSYASNQVGSNALLSSVNGDLANLETGGVNWGHNAPSLLAESGQRGLDYGNGALGYGSDENLRVGGNGYGRIKGSGDMSSMFSTGLSENGLAAANGLYGDAYADLYGGGSIYGDPTWGNANRGFDEPAQLGYDLRRMVSDVANKGSAGFVNGYCATDRQADRGIAALGT